MWVISSCGHEGPELISEVFAVDPLNNDRVQVDFKPLLQAIHIYNALDCRAELQKNYQQDRKVCCSFAF